MSEPVDPDNLKIVPRDPAAWKRWLETPPVPLEQRTDRCEIVKRPKKAPPKK